MLTAVKSLGKELFLFFSKVGTHQSGASSTSSGSSGSVGGGSAAADARDAPVPVPVPVHVPVDSTVTATEDAFDEYEPEFTLRVRTLKCEGIVTNGWGAPSPSS